MPGIWMSISTRLGAACSHRSSASWPLRASCVFKPISARNSSATTWLIGLSSTSSTKGSPGAGRWPEIVGSVIEEGGDGLADASDVIKTSVVSEMGWPSFLSMSLVVPAPVGRRGIP